MKWLFSCFWFLSFALQVTHAADQSSECRNEAEVVFILDASSSIWGPDFRKQLNFVSAIITDLGIDPAMVRCALVTYGTEVRVEFGLGTYSSAQAATKVIPLVRQLRGGTRTDLALRRMRAIFEDEGRPGVPRIGLVITDGQSDFPAATAREAEAAHKDGIIVFAIGIGKRVEHRELRTIVSKDEFIFLLSSQDELVAVQRYLSRFVCNQAKPDDEGEDFTPLPECESLPLDLTFMLDHSISHYPENLRQGQRLVRSATSLLPISSTDSRVSVITFGDVPRMQFDLDEHANTEDMHKAVSLIGFGNSVSGIAGAFRILNSAERRYRAEAMKAAVLVTNSRAEDPEELSLLGEALKRDHLMLVFVVAVGSGVNLTEMRTVVSSPERVFLFTVKEYRDLWVETRPLVQRICEVGRRLQGQSVTTGAFVGTSTSSVGSSVTTPRPPKTLKPPKTPRPPKTPALTTTPIPTTTLKPTTTPRIKTTAIQTTTAFITTPTRRATTTEPSTPGGLSAPSTLATVKPPDVTTTEAFQSNWTFRTRRPSGWIPTPPRHCLSLQPLDVVVSLPDDLRPDDNDHALQFLVSLSDEMGLDGFDVRMGVTPRFCSSPVEGFWLDQGSEPDPLMKALDDQRFTISKSTKQLTNLLRHLRLVSFGRDQISGYYGAAKVAVILLDPDMIQPDAETLNEVHLLGNQGVRVVVVAVGGKDAPNGQLRRMTSCPTCLFTSSSYAELDKVVDGLISTITSQFRCIYNVTPA